MAVTDAALLGEMFPEVEADSGAVDERETHEMVLRINYDVHRGDDEALPADELVFRLRLGGIDARRVSVLQASRRVGREERAEPRS